MKQKRILLIASLLFAASEIVLGVLLQIAHGRAVSLYSYAAIVLAFLFCFVFADRTPSYLFTQLALLGTLCADYFLVLSEEQRQLPAMLFFSVAQLAYFARLYCEEECQGRRRVHLICRVVLSAVAVALPFAVLGTRTDVLVVASLFYYANLLLNIVFAFVRFERPGFFAVGLLLFAACDTLIGLSFLESYFTLPADFFLYRILDPGFNLAWAFYLPSQALLATSLLPRRLRQTKKEPN